MRPGHGPVASCRTYLNQEPPPQITAAQGSPPWCPTRWQESCSAWPNGMQLGGAVLPRAPRWEPPELTLALARPRSPGSAPRSCSSARPPHPPLHLSICSGDPGLGQSVRSRSAPHTSLSRFRGAGPSLALPQSSLNGQRVCWGPSRHQRKPEQKTSLQKRLGGGDGVPAATVTARRGPGRSALRTLAATKCRVSPPAPPAPGRVHQSCQRGAGTPVPPVLGAPIHQDGVPKAGATSVQRTAGSQGPAPAELA